MKKTTDVPKMRKPIPAFHVPPDGIDFDDTIRRLRQARHGLEEHSDNTSQHLTIARDNIDVAITQLVKYQSLFNSRGGQKHLPASRGQLSTDIAQ